MSFQKIVDCTGHITGCHKKNAKLVAEGFFDTMHYLDPEKKLVDLHMFDGANVKRKAKNLNFFLSYAVMYCWSRAYLP